ncbi:class I SAM-dependent methyltransferase [Paraburkholderia sp. SIMBA_049]
MSSSYNDKNLEIWGRYYASLRDSFLFPNEYVVRSFLGNYPNLKMNRNYKGARVCDISCGDGRNLTALHKLGLKLYGTEISDDICRITKEKLAASSDRITADVRTGSNVSLPFEDEFFDYLLSWNACYYMQNEKSKISDHIVEYARIAKSGAYLIVSVPSPGCFSLIGCEDLGGDLVRIKTNSKWDILNGSIYYRFRSFDDIEEKFGQCFTNFQKCTLTDDCYGLPLEYFIFVCQKA